MLFQVQALQSFEQVIEDYLDFMQDLVQRRGSVYGTICGRSRGSGNNGANSAGGVFNRSIARAPLGLLAACRFPNSTSDMLGVEDPMEIYRNMTRMLNLFDVENTSKTDDNQPKQCSELNYNTTNRKGDSDLHSFSDD